MSDFDALMARIYAFEGVLERWPEVVDWETAGEHGSGTITVMVQLGRRKRREDLTVPSAEQPRRCAPEP